MRLSASTVRQCIAVQNQIFFCHKHKASVMFTATVSQGIVRLCGLALWLRHKGLYCNVSCLLFSYELCMVLMSLSNFHCTVILCLRISMPACRQYD